MIQARKRFDVWTNLSLLIFIFYILFLALPLFTMLFKSFYNGTTGELSLAYFTKFFSKPYYLTALWNSMKVTVSVTLLAMLIATPLAYIMSTVKIKGSSAIQILILISSMSAPFIGAYSWILLLGRSGVITRFMKDTLGIAMPDIYGFKGILVVLTLQMVPLIFMYVSGALKNVDQSLMEAAESMGYKGISKMRKVLLPLILCSAKFELFIIILILSLLIIIFQKSHYKIINGYAAIIILLFTYIVSAFLLYQTGILSDELGMSGDAVSTIMFFVLIVLGAVNYFIYLYKTRK